MAIRIEHSEPIENGSIPFGNGTLQIRRITAVFGDEPNENGERSLVYDEAGELSNNFVVCWVGNEGSLYPLGSAKSFSTVFGMLAARSTAISEYMQYTLSSEIPMVPVAIPGEMEYGNAIILSNLLDATRDAHGSDSPEYKEMATDDVRLLVSRDVYARNVLAKLAQMIEKGYNEAHYESAADKIACIIKSARYLTSSGEISGLNLTAIDNLWNLVQQRIRIASVDTGESSVVDRL